MRSTHLPNYAKQIADKEPLIDDDVLPEFIGALERLQQRLHEPAKKKFYHFKTLKTHILPLTNVAFDKAGVRCAQFPFIPIRLRCIFLLSLCQQMCDRQL